MHEQAPFCGEVIRINMSRIALAATVVILLVIILTTATISVRRYNGYLEGLWSGDPGFLETAQLSDFQLYIGPHKHGKREGYLILADNANNFVANQAIEIVEPRLCSRWMPALRNAFKTRHDAFVMRDVQFVYSDTGSAPMPTSMKLTLSILDGTLTLYDGEKVYAFLEKDIAASNAAAEMASLLEDDDTAATTKG